MFPLLQRILFLLLKFDLSSFELVQKNKTYSIMKSNDILAVAHYSEQSLCDERLYLI